MADFVHLHCHSQFSLRDGACTAEELVTAAEDAAMSAMALTDHGNMLGLIPFYKEAKAQGITPIIGLEAYVAVFSMHIKTTHLSVARRPKEPGRKYGQESHHLILLASNETGYKNLVTLVSKSFTEGLYGRTPRIDKQLLRKHSEGLIGLSACMMGEAGYFLHRDDKQAAIKAIREYMDIFEGRFFLELMPHNPYNQMLVDVARDTGTDIVASQDVHYIKPQDAEIRKVVGFYGKPRGDKPMVEYDLSFKTGGEMEKLLAGLPRDVVRRAMDNTVKIADQCDVKLSFLEEGEKNLSSYPRYHGLTATNIESERAEANTLLRKRVTKKAQESFITGDRTRKERIEHELKVICDANIASYFLVEADILENAGGDRPIFCNARGSAAGSYVAYLLGITQVDPIEHGLLFERFLNEERPEMPDIDIDVEDHRRPEIFDYITSTYGQDRVARVLSFNTVQPRLGLKLAASYLDIPDNLLDEIYLVIADQVAILGDQEGMSGRIIEECIKNLPVLRSKMDASGQVRRMVELAARAEGILFSVSLHPAGILISRKPINELVPFWQRKGEVAVQVNYKDTKEIGLKFDFLLSKALTVTRQIVEQVKKIYGQELDIDDLPHDPSVYNAIGKGGTTGIFQLGTNLGKRVSKQLKPKDFHEIAILNAMLRPAPVKARKIEEYTRNRDRGIPEHKIMECNQILKETQGVLLLQEQIMHICVGAAGFNLCEADTMRSLLGKKPSKLKESQRNELNQLSNKFVNGVQAKGYSETLARKLLKELIDFSKYCFNKSHCVSYARLIYITAYLKQHYPGIYMCSWLNHANIKEDRIEYLNECKRLGIELMPPDINTAEVHFSLEMQGTAVGGIRYGLGFVKDVARHADHIVRDRRLNGPYDSFQDFLQRMDGLRDEETDRRLVNSKQIEALIKAGAFDTFTRDRNLLLRYHGFKDIGTRRKELRKIQKETGRRLRPSRGFCETDRQALLRFLAMPSKAFTARHRTQYEVDCLGTYLPANLTECINDNYRFLYLPPIERVLETHSGTLFKILGFVEKIDQEKRNRYGQVRIPVILSDATGKIKFNVDKFKFRQALRLLEVGNIVSITARTKIIKIRNEYVRIFPPIRIQVLG